MKSKGANIHGRGTPKRVGNNGKVSVKTPITNAKGFAKYGTHK